ncbi:MAG: hypothetical protein JSS17_13670 [Proteobacteria bacterium]|nr:hypothetical protein [Pseudomonadota bacterium]
METTRDVDGKVANETQWRGKLTLKESKSNDLAAISLNPLGIYVTNELFFIADRRQVEHQRLVDDRVARQAGFLDQGGHQAAHAAGSARHHPRLHPHQRWQAAM